MNAPATHGPDAPEHHTRAALWMIGAIVSFTAMAVAGRTLAADLDTFEIMLYRSVAGVLIVLAVARLTRRSGQIRARRLGLHFVRNLSHFAGQNLWFHAIAVIPLAQVFAFEFTSPIWVVLMSPLILGERLTRRRLMVAAIGFAGVLMVSRPGLAPASFGTLAAALAAIGFAGSAIFTKILTRTEPIISILFWLTLMQALFGLLTAGYDADIALPDSRTAPWLILVAICGLTAHYSLTRALSLAPAGFVMPFDFARLPVIAIIGMVFYGEPIDIWVILGACVIFWANWLNIRSGRAIPAAVRAAAQQSRP